jgi:hypothetical protein
MTASMRTALCVGLASLMAGGTLASVGCGSGGPSSQGLGCNVSCGTLSSAATLVLSCGASDLSNVALSGPCAAGDAAAYSTPDSSDPQNVYVRSPSAGVCHVELTFATGFTYATDVTFTSTTITSGCCPGTGVKPTQSVFMVDNPDTTCVDAAVEGGVEVGADGGLDAFTPTP